MQSSSAFEYKLEYCQKLFK